MARKSHTRPVLLIDDSHEDLFLAKRLLSRAGVSYPIVTIDGGEEAIIFLRAATQPAAMNDLLPLVIFCDVKMPAYNGFDVLKWVREQKALEEVPFYILSGADLESDKQQALALGAKGYLVKFPIPDVWKKIVAEAEQA